MKDNKDLKLAVLIDADNIPYSNVKGMLNEIAKFGIPTIKRIYGQFPVGNLLFWRMQSLRFSSIVILQERMLPTRQ